MLSASRSPCLREKVSLDHCAMSEWYYTKEGKQEGPVPAEQIKALISQGVLNSQSDHVWREGLADWVTIQSSGILTQSLTSNIPAPTLRPMPQETVVTTPAPAPAQAAAVNPYSAPLTRSPVESIEYNTEYPGLGRLAYFLWSLGIGVVGYALMFVVALVMASASGESSGGMVGILFVMLLFAIPSVFVAVKRLNNLGMSGWAIFYSLIPIVSIWISWRMVACPAGYADHKQLDKAGKVMTGLMVGFFVLYFIAAFALGISSSVNR